MVLSGGTALPAVLGMWAGGVDVYMQGELTGQTAGFWEIALGATFGYLNPAGALAGFGGGALGYTIADGTGYSKA